MKKYKLTLLVTMLCLVGCSQKDESPESITKRDVVQQKEVQVDKRETFSLHQVRENQTPIKYETISKNYIESVEYELKKIKEDVPLLSVSTVPSYEERRKEVAPVPAHIQNSTIKSVPR